jgi:uncharacterized membrane protein
MIEYLRIAQLLILVFGGIVIYYASKGYGRTRSKSLLLLAVGFTFVVVGAGLAGIFFELLNLDLITVETVQAACQAVGFFIIVYSLAGTKD